MPIRTIIIMCIMTLAPTFRASADVLVLEDGRTLRGEVVRQGQDQIEVRHQREGAWVMETFARRSVRGLYDEPGDQSDGILSDEVEGAAFAPQSQTPAESDSWVIAYIPLHGHVGGGFGPDAPEGFNAALIDSCFEAAQKAGAQAAILDIHSPGGLVDEMEAICETILAWRDRLRIVAWPGEAFSAAAIITMCCPEIIVRSDSLFGAATIVTPGPDGVTPLEAKMASPHYARQRQYMKEAGRPYELIAAMTIQETRLWWSPALGFTSAEPISLDGWREVDSASTVLTMTAADALEWKIASHTADDVSEVVPALTQQPSVKLLDLTNHVEQHQRAAARSFAHVTEQFDLYVRGLASINQNLAALFEAKKAQRDDEADELRRKVLREIGRVRAAGLQIRRGARSDSTAGIEVPAELLARVEADRELLAEVAAGLRTEIPDRWNEAAQQLGRILRAWRDVTIGGER